MKKRLEVSLIDDGSKVQLRGVDDTRLPFHLFKQIKVTGLSAVNTVAKVFPSTAAANAKQPYKFSAQAEEARPETFQIELVFMGHYSEKNIQITINWQELIANGTIVYECVMDSQSGNWELCLMQNLDRDMVGIAEFTQSNRTP